MSKIEWTERSWNPIVGCAIVSPGCKNCYAMRTAHRLGRNPATPVYAGLTHQVNGKAVWTGEMRFHETALALPLRRQAPTTWFVNSMSDLFAEGVKAEWLDRVFAIMARSQRHTFQILTKRADRMQAYLTDPDTPRRIASAAKWPGADPEPWPDGGAWPLPNVWLGVSTEDQARADERIPHLLATPAAVRWISAEPLLGPLDLESAWHGENALNGECWGQCEWCDKGLPPMHNCQRGRRTEAAFMKGRDGLDWIVVGGESGPNARPMHPDWVRQLRDICHDEDVPFFFKQWGEWSPADEWSSGPVRQRAIMMDGQPVPDDVAPQDVGGHRFVLRGKRAAGRLLDGVQHDGMPR